MGLVDITNECDHKLQTVPGLHTCNMNLEAT